MDPNNCIIKGQFDNKKYTTISHLSRPIDLCSEWFTIFSEGKLSKDTRSKLQIDRTFTNLLLSF